MAPYFLLIVYFRRLSDKFLANKIGSCSKIGLDRKAKQKDKEVISKNFIMNTEKTFASRMADYLDGPLKERRDEVRNFFATHPDFNCTGMENLSCKTYKILKYSSARTS